MTNHYGYTPQEIQAIRIKVREKVNYKCYFCRKNTKESKPFTIHHIIPKRLSKEKSWEENNLICICKDCHNKIEKLNHKLFTFLEGSKYHYPK